METSLGPTKNASVNPEDRISEYSPPGSDNKNDFFSEKAREECVSALEPRSHRSRSHGLQSVSTFFVSHDSYCFRVVNMCVCVCSDGQLLCFVRANGKKTLEDTHSYHDIH